MRSSASRARTAAASPTQRWERRYRDAVDAAAMEFSDRGYASASTEAIAERLGIRQGSLYYYFASKEAALAAVCRLGVEGFLDELRRIAAEPASCAEKIGAVVANHLSPLRARPRADYVRVFLRHRHDLPEGPRQVVAKLARDYERLIEGIFADGRAVGELRHDLDPRVATLALLGLCNSVIATRHNPRASWIDRVIHGYARIFVDGVLAVRR